MERYELSPEPAAIETGGASEAARRRPGQAEIEAAVRTLIAAAGDDPARDGLTETPARVARAYREWFSGYRIDPHHLLSRSFGETAGTYEQILLRPIPLVSHCEHHLTPLAAVDHFHSSPRAVGVGISKLARPVDSQSHRRTL